MPKATCAEGVCPEKLWARGLCRRHYGLAYRRGTLPPLPPKQLVLGIHSLSDIDDDARTADCAVCGPGARIRLRTRPGHKRDVECATKDRENRADRRLRARLAGRFPDYDPEAARGRRLMEKYRITVGDYERMFGEQQGRCAICGTPHPRLFVDHDHATGEVRGLLCHACNIALGWLRDNADAASEAANYLRSRESLAV